MKHNLYEILRKGNLIWNQFMKSSRSKKISLKGCNLNGLSLNGYNFRSVDFSKSNLVDTIIINCDFTNCTLFDCNLNHSYIENCNFFESSLSCSLINNALIKNCDFKRSDLIGCEIKNSILEFIDLRLTRLEDTNFNDSLLKECKVYGASIWNTKAELNKDSTVIITPDYENEIITKDLYLAQYLYLMHKRGIVNMHKIKIFDPKLSAKKESYKYHIFVSHASEDKDDFVRPLVKNLENIGLKIWYDEFTLSPGDSLREKIDLGLSESLLGLVILSKYFFEKAWTKAELNAIFSIDLSKNKYLIPLWYNIDKNDVLKFSPLLADKIAINYNGNIDYISIQILKEINKITNL